VLLVPFCGHSFLRLRLRRSGATALDAFFLGCSGVLTGEDARQFLLPARLSSFSPPAAIIEENRQEGFGWMPLESGIAFRNICILSSFLASGAIPLSVHDT
jgi:hypothetical protein